MNPLSTAIKGKGLAMLLRRGIALSKHYGLTPERMNAALAELVALLQDFGCSATFPVTAVALQRSPDAIRAYSDLGIEFAIHGYRHVDHLELSLAEQMDQLARATQVFERAGILCRGFRGPYLHTSRETLTAVHAHGLRYDSSQALSWDVLDGGTTPAYRHALHFYEALPASAHLALPRLEGDLVRIPYSLPDDEALVDRLSFGSTEQMCEPWIAILRRSHELGELFVVGLHPERVYLCREPLQALLSEARQLGARLWIARLAEVADWWWERRQTTIQVNEIEEDGFLVEVSGLDRLTVLVRGANVDAPTRPWGDGYEAVGATTFAVASSTRPCLGVSPEASRLLPTFLREQGYAFEISAEDRGYACYLNRTEFAVSEGRSIIAEIERVNRPLVRLGRWPNGARSALAITGDIDALTLWDYGWRYIGR
jgi:peptidoglycan/xylan/chitin deacetylase (PgdA/CDA1 family)